MVRKNLHVSFSDGVLTVPIVGNDPVCRIWPDSKTIRNIVGVQTIVELKKLAISDDRTIRKFIIHKVKEHFNLIKRIKIK